MIGIIGSGNVGANTAFFLSEKGVDDVLLHDISEGMAEGKALDMMEAAPIRGYRTRITGVDRPEPVLECDLVIITAGVSRKPGMKRDALFSENMRIIDAFAGKMTNPETKVIIVSEPVDVMTTAFTRKSGLPATRVMGLGGVLDATRLRYLIASALGVSMENVAAQVIGRHTDDMIILKSYCNISGISLDNFLSPVQIETIFENTRRAGSLIVELAGRASAYYGPSAVVAELAEAIVLNTGRLMSVSHVLSGRFGINGQALSLPCIIDKYGISRVIEPRLNEDQVRKLAMCAEQIESTIKEAT